LPQREFPRALAHAGAALRNGLPALAAFQIRIPERPGAALERADGIDRAAAAVGFVAGDWFEEDAVVLAVGLAIFFQAQALAEGAAVFGDDLCGGEF